MCSSIHDLFVSIDAITLIQTEFRGWLVFAIPLNFEGFFPSPPCPHFPCPQSHGQALEQLFSPSAVESSCWPLHKTPLPCSSGWKSSAHQRRICSYVYLRTWICCYKPICESEVFRETIFQTVSDSGAIVSRSAQLHKESVSKATAAASAQIGKFCFHSPIPGIKLSHRVQLIS
jgi:hypothetical protein